MIDHPLFGKKYRRKRRFMRALDIAQWACVAICGTTWFVWIILVLTNNG